MKRNTCSLNVDHVVHCPGDSAECVARSDSEDWPDFMIGEQTSTEYDDISSGH